MKPVAIFRHAATEGPAYFATFLEAHGIPWQLVAIDAGATLPADAGAFSGLALMGGAMSVNDPLPWIDAECRLIRDAVHRNVPVIGHCLGGQLMSKALGGTVSRNPVKEIGWSGVTRLDNEAADRWLGGLDRELTVFQWHGETFSIPRGATRILGNSWCGNQMFVLGPHLAMQCHVEMTPEMIAHWCRGWADEASHLGHLESVQTPERMLAEMPEKLPVMRRLADRLYGIWIENLKG